MDGLDFSWLIELVANYPIVSIILMSLSLLVMLGQGIIIITPTKEDDIAWEKIKAWPVVGHLLSILEKFGPFKKK